MIGARNKSIEETDMERSLGEHFEVPAEMRAFAEKSVEQARQAFESFVATAHRTVSAFEGQAETTRKGAKEVGERAMSFAERNIASSFDFAQKIVRARDVNEMVKLQGDYINEQMKALSAQAKDLGESTTRMAKEAAQTNQ
jgi:phasin